MQKGLPLPAFNHLMGAASGKAQFHAVVYQFILHIDDWVSLPDKVHESRALVALGSGMAVGVDLLKQEGLTAVLMTSATVNAHADGLAVYVGFPIWWYTAPTIINTFMESYDFKGKTVLLNCLTNIAKSIL